MKKGKIRRYRHGRLKKLEGYPVEWKKLLEKPGSSSEANARANQKVRAKAKRKVKPEKPKPPRGWQGSPGAAR